MALQIGVVHGRIDRSGPVRSLLEHSAPNGEEPQPRLSAGKGRTWPRVMKVAECILIDTKPPIERRVGME
jgi:hypothetical protein